MHSHSRAIDGLSSCFTGLVCGVCVRARVRARVCSGKANSKEEKEMAEVREALEHMNASAEGWYPMSFYRLDYIY